jgi:hypothetical protein
VSFNAIFKPDSAEKRGLPCPPEFLLRIGISKDHLLILKAIANDGTKRANHPSKPMRSHPLLFVDSQKC